jgi:hypothetical protein
MRVSKLVPKGSEVADDRLAIAENALEDLLSVLDRSKLQAFGGNAIELRQIIVLSVFFTELVDNVLANGFEQGLGGP